MNLLLLPDIILLQVTYHLGLKDLLALGDSHSKLREVVYKSPEIWTSDLLFPIGDKSITDKFIQRIIPRITRHYGILELRMIDLPLTWSGYLMIFDQFAHSVNRIEIKATADELNKLAHHLSVFAGNLAMLQQNNKIPITFRQYAFDDEEEYSLALADSNYLGQRTLHNLNDQFARMKLDDPPFERLHDFRVTTTTSSNHENTIMAMRQLELLASFLSGRPINVNSNQQQQHTSSNNTPRSPIPTAAILYSNSSNNKRTRDDHQSSSSSTFTTKHPRQDNGSSSYYSTQQQYQQYSSSLQYPNQQQQQQKRGYHQEQHQQESQQKPYLPSYSSFA